MDITVAEIMGLADMHAHAKITDGTPAHLLPRNLLERMMEQICTDFFILQCKLIEARREIASLQAQLEAVGAGGVGPLGGNGPLICEGTMPAAPAQPVAWAIFAENGNCRMWTQNKGHADVAAKDTGLPLTALYAAPQPAAQAQPVATIYVTEDGSREVDDWKVELPVGATTLYTAAQAQEDAGGWMRDGGMLYRLTDERRPTNFDEIRVTMANGSRDTGQLSAQAERLLVMLAAPQPPAQAQEDAPDMFWDADDTENFAHEVQDIVDGYCSGEIVTIECAKRMPNFRVLITGEGDSLSYEHIDAASAAQQGTNAS